MKTQIKLKRFPLWFFIGIALNLIFWIISWASITPFSYYSFFFIWLGYILIVDGINFRLTKWSMLSKNKWAFLFMFILGGIFWWYFEVVVEITKNWYYISSKEWSSGLRVIAATLFFSTFFICVLETISLVINLKVIRNPVRFIKGNKTTPLLFFSIGLISIPLTILFPQYFFPFLWITLYLILDPINYWAGRDSLLRDCINNNWNRIFAIALGGLITGVFWELWNYNADPRWIYTIPYVDFIKIFEMPLLGFLGYIPFAFELFALYALVQDSLGFPHDNYFVADRLKAKRIINYKIIILISIFLMILINIFVEINNNESMRIVPNTTESNSEQTNMFEGTVYLCGLGLNKKAKCLVTENREAFILHSSESLEFKLGKITLEGEIIEQTIGLDFINVNKIFAF